jgi:hypothetical protein
VSNITAVLGEFGDPRLPRRDSDGAFLHDVVHHVVQRAAYIQALAACMPAGSRLGGGDYDKNVPGVPHSNQPEMLIGPEDVATWMSEAGFAVTREIEMFDDKFFVEYTKR